MLCYDTSDIFFWCVDCDDVTFRHRTCFLVLLPESSFVTIFFLSCG